MNVLTRGIRNAFRNSIRSGSIVLILGLTMGLSLSMLVARQAVSDKIASIKASTGNTITISPAGVRGFEGGGDALTTSQLAAIEDLAHVKSISTSLNDRLSGDSTSLQSAIEAGSLGQRFSERNGTDFVAPPTMMFRDEGSGSDEPITCTFTPPITVIGTTTPAAIDDTQGGGTFELTDGKVFAGNSSENVALLGTSLAEKNSLKVGSTFTAYGQTITVSGIFDAGNDFSNNQLIMPLKTVQTLSEQTDSITNATVTVDSISNVESVTTAIQSKLGSDADVTNDAARTEEVVAPLESIRTVTLFSLIGSVVAGSVVILLTMIMIVRERRREVGVLKAIGASNLKVIGQFTAEAVTLTGLGAIIGVIIGTLAANPLTSMLVSSSQQSDGSDAVSSGPGPAMMSQGLNRLQDNVTSVTTTVGWDILLYGLAAALIIGVVGSAMAAFFIAKVRPAEVMRSE